LPVWINGNAYFNGAKAYHNEKSNLVDNKNKVTVKLVEKNGKFSLETNIYKLLGEFQNGIVTSDILGYAFEPEQRFENSDGSDITFDKDYLGNYRGLSTIPGPFAEGDEVIDGLW